MRGVTHAPHRQVGEGGAAHEVHSKHLGSHGHLALQKSVQHGGGHTEQSHQAGQHLQCVAQQMPGGGGSKSLPQQPMRSLPGRGTPGGWTISAGAPHSSYAYGIGLVGAALSDSAIDGAARSVQRVCEAETEAGRVA
jgi:hypothetical protein